MPRVSEVTVHELTSADGSALAFIFARLKNRSRYQRFLGIRGSLSGRDPAFRPGDVQPPPRLLHIGHGTSQNPPARYLCGAPVRSLLATAKAGCGPRGPRVCPACARLDASYSAAALLPADHVPEATARAIGVLALVRDPIEDRATKPLG